MEIKVDDNADVTTERSGSEQYFVDDWILSLQVELDDGNGVIANGSTYNVEGGCCSLSGHDCEGLQADVGDAEEGTQLGEEHPSNLGGGDGDGGDVVPPPAVGMVFRSLEELNMYYRSYGKQEGFGVVRAVGFSYCGKHEVKKPLRYYAWTCDRHGRPIRKRKTRVKKDALVTDSILPEENFVKTSKIIDWSAMIYASVNSGNELQLRRVINEHRNHVPKPKNSRCITEYRKQQLTNQMKRQMKLAYAASLSVAEIYNLIVTERNGHEEFGLTKTDIRNEVDGEKRLIFKDGDADAMVEYFKKMIKGNHNFFHAYRLDNKGNMQDILWVNARSRATYEEFGDFVCFDTTYLTNEYELPFANVVGVNHHGQTILLDCALISRETTETFQWVFSTWLHCMVDKAPRAILTDQCAAMRKALSIEMPKSRH